MKVLRCRVVVHFAWWWTWLYAPAVVFLATLGATPDWDKVGRIAGKAVRIKLVFGDVGVLEA